MICDAPLRHSALSYPAHAGNLGATSESFDYLFRVHKDEYRTLNRIESSNLDRQKSRMLDMSTASERIEKMMSELGVDQPAFGKLAGASKSVVNQWLSGKIKSIAAEYAFTLQKKTGYSAEWIQLGTGDEKLPEHEKLLSGMVLEVAKRVAQLSPEQQLKAKHWASVELDAKKAQDDLEAAKLEADRKSS